MYRDQALGFARVNDYMMSSVPPSGSTDPGRQDIKATVSPNPFNPSTRLILELVDREIVRVTVYDVQGRLVKRLLHAPLSPGRHVVEWNATTANGRPVVSGVYFMRIETGNRTRTIKLTVLK
jgi:hypothetical protein